MSTDTSSALDQPAMTAPTPKPPRDKVMRIATMTKQLLDEVRTQPLDAASLDRLRTIDTQIIGELLTDLTPDLREELQRLALPITRHTEMSDSELRLAHAHAVRREGPRCRRVVHGPAGAGGGALRGREDPDPGTQPHRTGIPDAAGRPGAAATITSVTAPPACMPHWTWPPARSSARYIPVIAPRSFWRS